MNKEILSKEKREEHFKMFFNAIDPQKIGKDYEKAVSTGKSAEAIKRAAEYFRKKEIPELTNNFVGKYDPEIAEKGVLGIMREVSIDYAFPEGKIDFLFNPTIENPPRKPRMAVAA